MEKLKSVTVSLMACVVTELAGGAGAMSVNGAPTVPSAPPEENEALRDTNRCSQQKLTTCKVHGLCPNAATWSTACSPSR